MNKFFLAILLFLFSLTFYSCGSDSGSDSETKGDVSDSDNIAVSDESSPQESSDYEDVVGSDETASDCDFGDDNQEEEPEETGKLIENEWVETSIEDTSTFSIDVDTASYTLVRNYLMNYNRMPDEDSIRIEELINYFDYNYPQPEEGKPFSTTIEMAKSPWNEKSSIVMFGLKGKEIDPANVPSSNFVFLLDVSGSMSSENKLPLLVKSFKKLLPELDENDRVSIVTYAGSSEILLDSVPGNEKETITKALDSLTAGGSTAGAKGITTAYELAEKNLNSDGNNRVILATDGDFNVGISSNEGLVELIEKERDKGIFLSILGFGIGNYQDEKMEELSNAGNGNYFYIDTEKEADKVFIYDLMGTMFTIAKDVKLQVVFNPAKIEKYRLIGYENRVLNNEDFNDDTKDAGEIGAGHRVTAFYEVILKEESISKSSEDDDSIFTDSDTENNDEFSDEDFIESDSDYIETENEISDEDVIEEEPVNFGANEYLLLKMRYKEPTEDLSKYFDTFMTDENITEQMSENMGFASAVTEFGMLLRKSKFKENASYDAVIQRATANIGTDKYGFRGEFLEIAEKAKALDYSE